MPHRNTIKQFVEDGTYHVYNRGVEKRKIFIDDQDYRVFIHLLKYYLSPSSGDIKNDHPIIKTGNLILSRPRPLINLENEVELIAYCLMPNHFHLLLKQNSISGMTKLLRSISTTYAMYFNRRYNRVGYLYQGRYKAVLINSDPVLLHISRYIHLNPLPLMLTRTDLVSYPYSSYPYFLGIKNALWLKPKSVLSLFNNKSPHGFNSYKGFVEQFADNPEKIIKETVIDIDD